MRKEVVPHKKAKKYKIIHQSFHVDLKRRIRDLQINLQIFSQHPNVEELPTKDRRYNEAMIVKQIKVKVSKRKLSEFNLIFLFVNWDIIYSYRATTFSSQVAYLTTLETFLLLSRYCDHLYN